MRLLNVKIGSIAGRPAAAVGAAILGLALAMAGASSPALAQNFGVGVLAELVAPEYDRGEVRDLKIGMHYFEILPIFYFEHACGSNGGPPLQPGLRVCRFPGMSRRSRHRPARNLCAL